MAVYRKVTLVVCYPGDEQVEELLPAVLTTLGAVGTPYIGGTGIMVLDVDEAALELAEVAGYGDPGGDEGYEFPATFSTD